MRSHSGPRSGKRRSELVVDAMRPTGEDEPSAGGKQFAVVGGKAPGASQGSRMPAADERAVGLGGRGADGELAGRRRLDRRRAPLRRRKRSAARSFRPSGKGQGNRQSLA